ncbi:hypothetical protein DIURU_004617 [Diutina rugosa]|uniref:Myb-like domain-containing protein n=1 Tax=Diutina rugosa TaxID=5481 RepID=A0A642UNE3_DIURU|nr:uncharacterized protein DIURU_004617 [Diutina rugosa]KAA8898597.1 hypothetical protein DIURU_004617 [Diutina rugosa]
MEQGKKERKTRKKAPDPPPYALAGYVDFYNRQVQDFFSVNDPWDQTLPASVITSDGRVFDGDSGHPGSLWSPQEKDKFYRLLERYSIHRIDMIAEQLPSKSAEEIMVYYNVLRKSLQRAKRKGRRQEYPYTVTKRRKTKHLKGYSASELVTYDEMPIAYEMSEGYLIFEDIQSKRMTDWEPPDCSLHQLEEEWAATRGGPMPPNLRFPELLRHPSTRIARLWREIYPKQNVLPEPIQRPWLTPPAGDGQEGTIELSAGAALLLEQLVVAMTTNIITEIVAMKALQYPDPPFDGHGTYDQWLQRTSARQEAKWVIADDVYDALNQMRLRNPEQLSKPMYWAGLSQRLRLPFDFEILSQGKLVRNYLSPEESARLFFSQRGWLHYNWFGGIKSMPIDVEYERKLFPTPPESVAPPQRYPVPADTVSIHGISSREPQEKDLSEPDDLIEVAITDDDTSKTMAAMEELERAETERVDYKDIVDSIGHEHALLTMMSKGVTLPQYDKYAHYEVIDEWRRRHRAPKLLRNFLKKHDTYERRQQFYKAVADHMDIDYPDPFPWERGPDYYSSEDDDKYNSDDDHYYHYDTDNADDSDADDVPILYTEGKLESWVPCLQCQQKVVYAQNDGYCSGDRPQCLRCYNEGIECTYATDVYNNQKTWRKRPRRAPLFPDYQRRPCAAHHKAMCPECTLSGEYGVNPYLVRGKWKPACFGWEKVLKRKEALIAKGGSVDDIDDGDDDAGNADNAENDDNDENADDGNANKYNDNDKDNPLTDLRFHTGKIQYRDDDEEEGCELCRDRRIKCPKGYPCSNDSATKWLLDSNGGWGGTNRGSGGKNGGLPAHGPSEHGDVIDPDMPNHHSSNVEREPPRLAGTPGSVAVAKETLAWYSRQFPEYPRHH